MAKNPDREWEAFGRRDAFYGVVTLDRFRRDRITDEDVLDFFRSGEEHIAFIFKRLAAWLGRPMAPQRALDFGCGVGRCTIPLASRCRQVVGADVADSMLKEARRECNARSLDNVDLVQSDDGLSRLTGTFDFLHSFITFQHIPPARGERIFARLLAMLSADGAGVCQFLYFRDVSRPVRIGGFFRKNIPLLHNLLNLAAGKPFSEPLVEKNCYDMNRLLRILHDGGCERVQLMFEGEGALRSVVLFFAKTRDRLPYEAFYNQSGKGREPAPRTGSAAP